MKQLVIIPTYNTGKRVLQTLDDARRFWQPVWLVVDGSTDGTAEWLRDSALKDDQVQVFVLSQNSGKGAAVLHGLRAAARQGYSHALVMDADGQHPAERIPELMAVSRTNPDAQILGRPIFDASAPIERVLWRHMSNLWVHLETQWAGIGDSLFGFRVYPIAPLLEIMESTRWMRRFDFDAEAAVRLCWRGVRPVNIPVPVRYLTAEEGGVSQFRYLRDNLLLTWMHIRLVLELLFIRPWRH